jgi:hypothetical protein
MTPPSSNVRYMARLVNSGFEGAVSVGRLALEDGSGSSVLSHSVQESWKPAAIGACIGVLVSIWKGDRKLSSALWCGFLGSALGLTQGVLWNSRGVTNAVMRGALKNVNAARDERWLELNPVNYG